MGDGGADWRRACTRGALIGVVAAAHLALYVVLVMPASPRKAQAGRAAHESNVLRVFLLPSRPPQARTRREAALPHPRPLRPAHLPRPSPATPSAASRLRVTFGPAPDATGAAPGATFIAGGGLLQRLRAAQAPPATPKLPGGRHYLAADLQFQTIEQRSIAGKVQMVGSLLFGGFDPACENTRYELAKPRAQQIADGYTQADLERRLREHHCG